MANQKKRWRGNHSVRQSRIQVETSCVSLSSHQPKLTPRRSFSQQGMKCLLTTIAIILISSATVPALMQPAAMKARQQSVTASVKPPVKAPPVHKQPAKASSREQSVLARITVYWAGGRGSDRYTRQHKSAIGTRLRHGHCAVDPRKIPYGSNVVFPDGTKLSAVDTGSAVKSRKAARKAGRNIQERTALVVDRFFETKSQALAWARRNPLFMPVKVLLPDYTKTTDPSQPTSAAATANSDTDSAKLRPTRG